MNANNLSIVLTIAIPTYNRADLLNRCLLHLSGQLAPYKESVELLISDNHSTDSTAEIVRRHINTGMEIRYVRNEINMGADANFVQCFRLARGKYVWILGDDDLVVEPALSSIMGLLCMERDFGVVHLRSYSFEQDHLRERPPNYYGTKYFIYRDVSKFLERTNYMLTFVSANIVNKSLVPLDFRFGPFMETNLVQTAWTFSAIFAADANAVVNEALVASVSEKERNYPLCKIFCINLNAIFDRFVENGVQRSYFDRFNRVMLQVFFPHYIEQIRRKQIRFMPEDFEEIMLPVLGKYAEYWVFTRPIIRLPLPLASVYVALIKFYHRGKKLLKLQE